MSILIYLIPAALFLGVIGLIGFIWSIRTGQFDDLDGAAMRILIDDKDLMPKTQKEKPDSPEDKTNS